VKLNVHPSIVYLSNAKSRWGSCNSKKEIRLNWRLIQAPPHIINYVICHELAHLKEMNHSNRFWEEVEKVLPEYRSSEKELKTLSSDLYLIG
jgi:predicted metal-dependent hydrolase